MDGQVNYLLLTKYQMKTEGGKHTEMGKSQEVGKDGEEDKRKKLHATPRKTVLFQFITINNLLEENKGTIYLNKISSKIHQLLSGIQRWPF
jgi:hypothetical protein